MADSPVSKILFRSPRNVSIVVQEGIHLEGLESRDIRQWAENFAGQLAGQINFALGPVVESDGRALKEKPCEHYNTHMHTHRMNITLPRDLVERLKRVPNKSAYIAEALREKLAAEEGGALLASAYREASAADGRLVSDWDALSGEGIP